MTYRDDIIDRIRRAVHDLQSQNWDWAQDFGRGLDGGPWVIEGAPDYNARKGELPDKVRDEARRYYREIRHLFLAAAERLDNAVFCLEAQVPQALEHLKEARRIEAETGDAAIVNNTIDDILAMGARIAVNDDGDHPQAIELDQAIALALTGKAEDGDYTLRISR